MKASFYFRRIWAIVLFGTLLPVQIGITAQQENSDVQKLVRSLTNSIQEAIPKLTESAKGGDVRAMMLLGELYAQGQAVPKNVKEAFYWFNLAAERGDQKAIPAVALMKLKGLGTNLDISGALNLLENAALSGCASCGRFLGELLISGDLVAKNELRGISWLIRAAETGDPGAQHALGWQLESGKILATNDLMAEEYYRRAFAQGRLESLFNLGTLLYRQDSAEKKTEGVKLTKVAAENGDGQAQFNLAVMLEDGTGITKDEKSSFIWYKRAADQGVPLAQYNVAVSYAQGKTVTKNLVSAHVYANLAATSMDEAKKLRQLLEEMMTRKEIDAAEHEAAKRGSGNQE